MRKAVTCWGLAFAVVLGVGTLRAGEVQVNAGALAAVRLSVPENQAEKNYLGLTDSGDFSFRHIKADTLIIEIFSMYCPICQGEAPKVNELHKLIEREPKLRHKVKLIGVGTGNTPLEVELFRKKYKVSFPLFPDDHFMIQKAFPKPVRTPTFVVLTINRGKKFAVAHALEGRFESAEAFLKSVTGSLSTR